MIIPESCEKGPTARDGAAEQGLAAIYARFPEAFKTHPAKPEWFTFPPYANIIKAYAEKGPLLTNAGGAFGEGNDVELVELSESCRSAAGIEEYIDIVRRYAMLRESCRQAQHLIDNATAFDVADVALSSASALSRGVQRSAESSWSDFGRDIGSVMDVHATAYRTIETGLPGLVMRTGELIVVSARPGGGKTTLVHQIAEETSLSQDGVTLVWTMEMTRGEWAAKTVQRLAGGYVSPQSSAWTAWRAQMERHYADRSLMVNDATSVTAMDMRAKCEELRADSREIGCIVIDYLTLMQMPRGKSENLTEAIGRTTKTLKGIAKDFCCPVLLCSQMTRKKGGDYSMDDLRSSDDIAMDANQIWILSVDSETDRELHPEQYDITLKRDKWRGGKVGVFHLTFLASKSTIIPNEAA